MTTRNTADNKRVPSASTLAPGEIFDRFIEVRAASEALAAPLSPEDQCLQSMEQASPTKWHLAHTTWFFETFVLSGVGDSSGAPYEPFDPHYAYLFNSYYNSVGPMHARPHRGLLSRPGVDEVLSYRGHVDEAIGNSLSSGRLQGDRTRLELLELGIHHEQQHQELILTDIKHALSANPMRPAYLAPRPRPNPPTLPRLEWIEHAERIANIGHQGGGFAFDNEGPRHRMLVQGFELGSRLVSCGEFLEFMEDGAYHRPELWLSEGWDNLKRLGWEAPGYWERPTPDAPWQVMTLHGPRDVYSEEPVAHVSFFEADAYARWAGRRLPNEAEWEIAAKPREIEGNFVEAGVLHPRTAVESPGMEIQLFGDVWEWTSSPYVAYPGYRVPEGPVGEYNGKFMCNQMVLRGGSCVTPMSHMRPTYRNFFPADTRWQFSGIRLAGNRD